MIKSVNKVFHSDSGHGWLAVRIKELNDLGIADKVSSYSYMNGKTAYLEEDCDASVYLDAQENKGVKVVIKRGKFQERSRVRSYQGYRV